MDRLPRNVRTCSGIQKRRRLRHSRMIRQIYITLALMIEILAPLAPSPRRGGSHGGGQGSGLNGAFSLRRISALEIAASRHGKCIGGACLGPAPVNEQNRPCNHAANQGGLTKSTSPSFARSPVPRKIVTDQLCQGALTRKGCTSAATHSVD